MQISQLETRYAELRQALDAGQLSIDEFQAAVDELQTQDDYGRYWMIGAETGVWYYFDGVEWTQADPHEADSLPFVDENGLYWMLGKETNQWYYYDGENWVSPEAQAGQDQTRYYQDEEGRYWAKGAESGEWYFYDEAGWHRADEIAPPPPPAPTPRPSVTPPPAMPDETPFTPIQPAPSYLQSPQPQQPAQPQPVQPVPQPQPQQPAQPQPVQPMPQPQPQQPAQPQPAQPMPQPQPQQPAQPPMDAALEPGVWFYFDGEQWMRYQDPTATAPQEQEPLPEEELEPGTWFYFDGQEWIQYHEDPYAEADLDEEEEEYSEDEDFEEEEAEADDETVIEIEDLDDYIEIVEVDEADIIDPEEDLVDAEFEVEILTPHDVAVAATTPIPPVQETPAEAAAPAEASARAAEARPKTEQVPVTPRRRSSTAVKPTPPPPTGLRALFKTLPSWIWTAVGGLATLVVAAFIIVGIVYLLNNRERAVSMLEAQLTPTLPAAVPATTPTPAATPSPTATQPPTPTSIPLTNFTSSYFGFSVDYPAGWVFKEDDDLVIFSPSARALDRTAVKGASLWILLTPETDITASLADGLARFDPISETLNEGIMNIGRQTWASAQISYNSPEMDADAIALVASTIVNGQSYTLLAVAPATEWESYKPLFQYAIDSFKFTAQQSAAAPADGTTAPAAQATTAPRATATATPTPLQVSTTTTYVVESGDTLGGIAVKFDVSVAELVKANGLDDDSAIIRIGQELIIPQAGVEVAAVTATPSPTAKATSTPKKATSTPKPTATPQATTVSATATITTTVATTATATEEATPAPTATAAPTATPEPAVASLSGKIAYPAYSTDINSFNVWQSNVDGSNPLIIAQNASQPQYDATGTLLAYRSWAPDRRGIVFVDYSGGRQDLLTTFVEDALPAWYTDGTLVITSRREGDRVPRLFRVDQRGDGGYGLGFIADYVDTLADNRLVARGCTVSGDCGLWVLLPDGGGETKISNETSDTAPAGHPQGGRIAIMSSGREQAGNWEIWTINEDGSDPVRLTDNPANDGLPAWSPDGQSIAFVSDRGGVWAIWAMNADGTDQRKLFDMQGSPDGQVLHDVDNSKGWLEERITWIP